MREGIHKHLALLGVELFEISEKFIYNLRQSHPRPEKVFDYLPTYTTNSNDKQHNQPVLADAYHQFVGMFQNDNKNDKYLYFNLNTLDKTLEEEIANAGVEDLFKDFDFKKILSNFTPQFEGDISNFVFPFCNYLVIEMTYITSYDGYSGGYDCDMELDIIGYLNNNLEIIKFG